MFPNEEIKHMLDLRGDRVKTLDVQIKKDGLGTVTVWVNVDGVCRFRITRVPLEKYVQDINTPNTHPQS